MRIRVLLGTASLAMFVAACGGGGGVNSTPTPTPSPTPSPTPTPTNSSIANLVASQTFASDASVANDTFDLTAGTVTATSVSSDSVSVAYDAATKSYTITTPDRATTFAPSATISNADGETRYSNGDGATRDTLTIATTPYTSTKSNNYVALGYLQHDSFSGSTQTTALDFFTFGLETPSSSVPRAGLATWTTDVFGLYSAPGQSPRTIQGAGEFTVDFAQGLYTTDTSVFQNDFLTGQVIEGAAIDLISEGRMGSGNSFTGNLGFSGVLGPVSGTLTGRFYGPSATEIGASFYADNSSGVTLSGALTGQQNPTATPTNFTLSNITTDQLFQTIDSQFQEASGPAGDFYSVLSPLGGQVTFHADGSITLPSQESYLSAVTFTDADKLAVSTPDFVSYQKDVDGTPARLDIYHPASGGGGIVLTYAGFGSWSHSYVSNGLTQSATGYFTYGFRTPDELLSHRTGQATYSGIVFGTAAADNGPRYSVGGTSQFNVDFSSQQLSGALMLNETPEAGGASAELGTWTFASPLMKGQMTEAPLTNGTPSNPNNIITPQFFGPNGEEIAAPFAIATGASIDNQPVSVVGATIAKPQ